MDDRRDKQRWTRSLGDAGLLDEIEDGWVLPEEPRPGDTIVVEGSGGSDIPASVLPSPKEEEPLVRAPAPRLLDVSESLPPTPLERHVSSDPAPRRASPSDVKARSASRTSQRDMWSPASSRISQRDMRPPLPTRPAPAQASRTSEPPVMSVRGARIAVASEALEEASKPSFEAIVDEPPDFAPHRRSEKSPAGGHAAVQSAAPSAPIGKGGVEELASVMRDRFELGDYSGCLDIAEVILASDASNASGERYRESCREVLTRMYESRIGSFEHVPAIAVSDQEIIWRNMDPAMGFILSRIDGRSSYEDIIDISGLPRFDTCRILGQLIQEGIIK
ncbi:MAG: hypothetical protein PHU25_13290 [Deltaproteobacteria bacterium]|nr:hypothetical protein [Deltaproteobacteria bacterium]